MRKIGLLSIASACLLLAAPAAMAEDPYVSTYGSEESAQHARDIVEQLGDPEARERYIRGTSIVTGLSRAEIETLLAEHPEYAALLTVELVDQQGRTLAGCPQSGPCVDDPASGTGRFVAPAPTAMAQPGDDSVATEGEYVIVNTDTYHVGPNTDADSQIEGEDVFMDSAVGAAPPLNAAVASFSDRAGSPRPTESGPTTRWGSCNPVFGCNTGGSAGTGRGSASTASGTATARSAASTSSRRHANSATQAITADTSRGSSPRPPAGIRWIRRSRSSSSSSERRPTRSPTSAGPCE